MFYQSAWLKGGLFSFSLLILLNYDKHKLFQKMKIQNKGTLKFGFNKWKTEAKSCLLYVNLVTKPFAESKMKLLKAMMCCIPNAGEKMRPICSNLKLCNFQWQELLYKNSDSPQVYHGKRTDDRKEDPINVNPLRRLFTKTISGICFNWRCFSQSNWFKATVKFSEQLLFQGSYFLGAATFSEYSLLLGVKLLLTSYFLWIGSYLG